MVLNSAQNLQEKNTLSIRHITFAATTYTYFIYSLCPQHFDFLGYCFCFARQANSQTEQAKGGIPSKRWYTTKCTPSGQQLLGGRVERHSTEPGAGILPVHGLLLALRRRRVEAHQAPCAPPTITNNQQVLPSFQVMRANRIYRKEWYGQMSTSSDKHRTNKAPGNITSWLD
jgi:hypothetical protein